MRLFLFALARAVSCRVLTRKDVYFLISICFLISGSVTYSLGTQVYVIGGHSLGKLLLHIAGCMALLYLIWYGHLRHTWWQIGFYLLSIPLLIGSSYIAHHYENGEVWLEIVRLCFPVLYSFYFFIGKPIKQRSDWLKFGWVWLDFIGNQFAAYLFIPHHLVPNFSIIALFAVFSDFRREEKLAALPPEERSWDFEKDEPAA